MVKDITAWVVSDMDGVIPCDFHGRKSVYDTKEKAVESCDEANEYYLHDIGFNLPFKVEHYKIKFEKI